MGFFSSIVHAVTHPIQTVTKTVTNPMGAFKGLMGSAMSGGPFGGVLSPASLMNPMGGPFSGLMHVFQPMLSGVLGPLQGILGSNQTNVKKIGDLLSNTVKIQQVNTKEIGALARAETRTQKILGLETKVIGIALKRQTRLRRMLVQQFSGMAQMERTEILEADRNNVLTERVFYATVTGVVIAAAALLTRRVPF